MGTLIGHTLNDRYHVREYIGRGGMADVYKVWDQDRQAHLALKLLHEDLAIDAVFLRRFRREAENLALLQHPNIVRYYGLEEDGAHAFMLMEFITGHSLKKEIFLAHGPMSYEQILEILGPVSSALNFAHKQKIVHCDIKPANIIIDENGKVLVTDFGIARATDSATLTMVGLGTPAYMAPEQIIGLDPMPQSDIYALGIMLYEMLTGGERPFTGENADITGTLSEKIRWEQRNLPPPSPARFNPNIPPEIIDVLNRCLSKEPEGRYQTAIRFYDALNAAAGLDVTQIEPVTPPPANEEEIAPAPPPIAEEPDPIIPVREEEVIEAAAPTLIDEPPTVIPEFEEPPKVIIPPPIAEAPAAAIPEFEESPLGPIIPPGAAGFAPPPQEYREESRPSSRRPLWVIGGIVLVLLIGGGLFLIRARRAYRAPVPEPPSVVEAPPTAAPAVFPTVPPAAEEPGLPAGEGWPRFNTTRDFWSEVEVGVPLLNSLAEEDIPEDSFLTGGDINLTVNLNGSDDIVLAGGWCTDTRETLEENLTKMRIVFYFQGDDITDQMGVADNDSGGRYCRFYYVFLTDWPAGDYEVNIIHDLDEDVYDGWDTYEAGGRLQTIWVSVR